MTVLITWTEKKLPVLSVWVTLLGTRRARIQGCTSNMTKLDLKAFYCGVNFVCILRTGTYCLY